MNSPIHLLASLSAGAEPDNEAVAWIARLDLADTVIWWAGLGVIVIGAGWWLVRSRCDPLARAPLRPNRLLPEYVFALMVVFVSLSMIAGAVTEYLAGDEHYRLTVGNVVQLVGAVACLVMTAKLFDGGLGRFLLGDGKIALRTVQGVVLLIVGLSVCSLVYEATVALISLLRPGYELPDHSVIEALHDGTESVWVLRIGAVVIAPIAEECFFRGMIQTALRNVLKRPWPAVLITAVLFGLAHSQQPQVIPTLAVLGVLLGASYERSGSLVAPIVLHSLFNLKTLVWEALGAGG